MKPWSQTELEASVLAYRNMQQLEAGGESYSKVAIYRELEKAFGRPAKAFEFRMQNISAVLQQRSEPWLRGLKPATHIGTEIAGMLEALLIQHKFKIKPNTATYKLKLPALRDWLIRVARLGQPVTYGEVMEAFGIDRFSLRYALSKLGQEAQRRNEPIITAMVVNKSSRRCGPGFDMDFGITDDDAERTKLHQFWQERPTEPSTSRSAGTREERIARFVSKEARPQQAAFRRRVFEACGERCVVSGCDVVEALDAAHKKGRNWRIHNTADDGYVLRKDLHALYDNDLLAIEANGTITLHKSVLEQYGHFNNKKITRN